MKYLITILFLSNSIFSFSQEITDFEWFGNDYEDELYLGIGVSGISLSNSKAPSPSEHKLYGTTLKLDMKYINYDVGNVKLHYENKLLGDLILIIADAIESNGSSEQVQQSYLTAGYLGWFSAVFNINQPEKYQIALGLNLNDFLLTSNYKVGGQFFKQEPQGYYFSSGPSASFTYYVNKLLMIEYYASLSIPFYKFSEANLKDKIEYKNPYLINNKIELITSKGLYGGLELSNIINRGNLPNNTKRSEWYIGFRFPI